MAFAACATGSQPLESLGDDLLGRLPDIGLSSDRFDELVAVQRIQPGPGRRDARRRSGHPSQEGDLSEEIACVQLVDQTIVGDHTNRAFVDDIEEIAQVTLLEHNPAERDINGTQIRRETLKDRGLEPGKQAQRSHYPKSVRGNRGGDVDPREPSPSGQTHYGQKSSDHNEARTDTK
jgi:hypothetical protein